MSDTINGDSFRPGRSSAPRRTGLGAVLIETTTPIETATEQGNSAWWYIGPDDPGRELEILAVELIEPAPRLFFIHVMPTKRRR